MELTRKSVLKGALVTAFVALSRKLLSEGKPKAPDVPPDYNPKDHKWGYGIDIDKCIGCGYCVDACKKENGIPLDSPLSRTWIERYQITDKGEVLVDSLSKGSTAGFSDPTKRDDIVDTFFVPKLCNLCERSACTQVCPVGATFDSVDGPILVDPSYCIGCGYCVQACPYGTRFMNPMGHIADKCNMCYHRITRDMKPACVEVCPTEARVFGDRKDPKSDISKFKKQKKLGVLKAYLGTLPQVLYANIRKEIW